jgi:predicted NUDIX family NTP pyrophosphohydrolase
VASDSAGLLPYRRRDGHLEVLIAHMGGPFWSGREEGAWTIVKGELGDAEDALTAARREFEEETGAPAPEGPVLELGDVRQSGGKRVQAWAIEADLDPATMRSNTFSLEWPPRSGTMQDFPEVDRFEWCPPPVASRRLVKAQAALIARLAGLLDAQG